MNNKMKITTAITVATLSMMGTSTESLAISEKAKTQLNEGVKSYQHTIQLTAEGMTQNSLTEYLKQMRMYHLDSVKVGGLSNGKVTVYPKYFENSGQMREVNRLVSLIASEAEGLTDIEKVYYVSQRIGHLMDYNSSPEGGDTTIFSPYALVGSGEGVCQAYARFTDMVFKEMKLPTSFIEGQLNGTPHLWNAVKVNGEWYAVDNTSADTKENKIDFSYLLMNVKMLKDKGFSVTYTKNKLSGNNIQKFYDVGQISTKDKIFYSKVENGVLGVDYKDGSKVKVTVIGAEEYFVVGGDIIIMKDGKLSSPEGKVYSTGVVLSDITNTGTELVVNGYPIHTPINLTPDKVKLVVGDFKVTIDDVPDKKYYNIIAENGRTNIYFKDKFVLQVIEDK